MRKLLNSRSPMRAKPTISVVSFAKNDSRDMPQNSSSSFCFWKQKERDYLVFGLLEEFPHDGSYYSADYRCNPKYPNLTKGCTADEKGWTQASCGVN